MKRVCPRNRLERTAWAEGSAEAVCGWPSLAQSPSGASALRQWHHNAMRRSGDRPKCQHPSMTLLEAVAPLSACWLAARLSLLAVPFLSRAQRHPSSLPSAPCFQERSGADRPPLRDERSSSDDERCHAVGVRLKESTHEPPLARDLLSRTGKCAWARAPPPPAAAQARVALRPLPRLAGSRRGFASRRAARRRVGATAFSGRGVPG